MASMAKTPKKPGKRRPNTRRGPEPRKPTPGNPWPAKLRTLRESKGLTQEQAAEMCGVAARTWISWENSQSQPSRLARNLLKSAFPQLF